MLLLDPYTDSVLTNIGINIIVTLSLYFPLAVGQLSIAQVGFMAIGAHLATVLTLHLHTPFAVALIAAALVPWLIGVAVGHFFRRLHGLILALATFALMEVVQVFFLNFRPTGAAQGMRLLDHSLRELVQSGAVSREAALRHCEDPKNLGPER